MAATQKDIDTLSAAIYSGVKRVLYEGPPRREIEYQSLDQMKSLLADMRAELAGSSGIAIGRQVAVVSKGL